MHEKPALLPAQHQLPVAAVPTQQPIPLALVPTSQMVTSPLPAVQVPAPRRTSPNRMIVGV